MARGSKTKEPLQSQKTEPSLAASALDNLPVDKLTRHREFVDHLDQLEIDKKAAANDYAAHEKRLTDVFGVDKFVQSAIKKLRKMKTDQRARVLRQLVFFVKDLELTDPQGSLFNDDGQPGGIEAGKDEGAVFDKTGNKAAPNERREPEKKLTGAEPPPHVPTPGIPLDEAQAGFDAAKEAAEKKRGGKPLAALPKPPGAAAKPALPVPPGASNVVGIGDGKKTGATLTKPQTAEAKAAAKKTADKYLPPAGADPVDLNSDNMQRTYKVD